MSFSFLFSFFHGYNDYAQIKFFTTIARRWCLNAYIEKLIESNGIIDIANVR